MLNEPSIFTRIIAGEIPGYIPFQDEKVAVLVALEGHLLVVPKVQYQDLFEIPEETAAYIMKIAVRLATVVKEITNCDGINLIQSNGTAAGQEVFHFHLHIKPRFVGDDTNIHWDTTMRPLVERESLAESIKTRLVI